MNQTPDAYTARPSGDFYEILDIEGYVIAWAATKGTAVHIVSLLNLARLAGLIDRQNE